MAFTKFGPGTVTYTVGAGTPTEFAQEVKAATVSHEYEDVGDPTTYLDVSADVPGQVRGDSVTLTCDFDLGSAGFYNFLYTNDGTQATLAYTPNTADGASWSGTVQLRLPDAVAADSFGAKLSGDVTHPFVGPVTFTPIAEGP